MRLDRGRRLALFYALLYVASGSIALTFHLTGATMGSPATRALLVIYAMIPGLSALIVHGALAKEPVLRPLGIRPRFGRFLLVAWLLPLLILGAWAALAALFFDVELATTASAYLELHRADLTPEQLAEAEKYVAAGSAHPIIQFIVQGMIAGVTLNLFVSLGEELGFRGYLHHELGGGFYRRVGIIGLSWGLFYAPIVAQGYLYPDHPAVGVGLVMVQCLLLSVILEWLRVRSQTVFGPAIFRGTWLALSAVPLLLAKGTDLAVGFGSGPALIGLALIAGAVLLGRPDRADDEGVDAPAPALDPEG